MKTVTKFRVDTLDTAVVRRNALDLSAKRVDALDMALVRRNSLLSSPERANTLNTLPSRRNTPVLSPPTLVQQRIAPTAESVKIQSFK